MTIARQKLQAQWALRNNSMKENAQPKREEGQTRETEYAKNAEGADIMQLVEIHPEMPEEM